MSDSRGERGVEHDTDRATAAAKAWSAVIRSVKAAAK